MKNKPLLVVAAVVALGGIVLLLATLRQPALSDSKPTEGSTDVTGERSGNGAGAATAQPVPAQDENDEGEAPDMESHQLEETALQLVESESSFDPVADAQRRKDLPFQFIGSGAGSHGKIVDNQGNVIMETDPSNGVFMMGIDVSPDENRILIYRGNADYDIFTPATGESVRLPQQPPGENVLGFGSWHWLDDRMLIGVSGKNIPFRDDQVGPVRNEPIISRSLLYIYDLRERKMSEIALPPALRLQGVRVVSVSAVDETGKVQLRPEDREVSLTDASLGWFEVRPK